MTKRRWFQFHLSTAIILMFVAGGLMWANFRTAETGKLIGFPIPFAMRIPEGRELPYRMHDTYVHFTGQWVIFPSIRLFCSSAALVTNTLANFVILAMTALALEWALPKTPRGTAQGKWALSRTTRLAVLLAMSLLLALNIMNRLSDPFYT